MKKQITITENTIGSFHRLPEYQAKKNLEGMTLRQALTTLRSMDFGNMGGMMDVILSDGTTLSVDLEPVFGGGYTMSSQKIRRNADQKCIRKYSL